MHAWQEEKRKETRCSAHEVSNPETGYDDATYYDEPHVPPLLIVCAFWLLLWLLQPLSSRKGASFRGDGSMRSCSSMGWWAEGVAIVRSGEPAKSLFFGEARKGTHQPVNSETSYNWASIAQDDDRNTHFAVARSRDVSLSDPAVRYVPELRQVHDAFGPIDAITIRELLTHSAGFRNPPWPWDCDDASNCDWQPFEPTQWAQVSAMLPYTHIAFIPGTQWSYSNLGYVFLGQIIQRLSGDDFEVYVDKNILKPLGMTESSCIARPIFSSRMCRPAICAQADPQTCTPLTSIPESRRPTAA